MIRPHHPKSGIAPHDAHPDRLMPLAGKLGHVMALTRNRVHERKGVYKAYH